MGELEPKRKTRKIGSRTLLPCRGTKCTRHRPSWSLEWRRSTTRSRSATPSPEAWRPALWSTPLSTRPGIKRSRTTTQEGRRRQYGSRNARRPKRAHLRPRCVLTRARRSSQLHGASQSPPRSLAAWGTVFSTPNHGTSRRRRPLARPTPRWFRQRRGPSRCACRRTKAPSLRTSSGCP